VAESIRQGADADLAKLKGAPFLKNAIELPFQPHVLEGSKPAVRFHSNVLHCAVELPGRPEHYSISSIACHGQAAADGYRCGKPVHFSGAIAAGRPAQPYSAKLDRQMYLSATMSLQGASRAAGLKLKPRLQANIAAEVMSAFIN
jgi:hypothetical protein